MLVVEDSLVVRTLLTHIISRDPRLELAGAVESGEAALAAIDAYPYASIDEGLTKEPAAVRKLHEALKAVTDALKAEFVSVLSFEVPKTAAGDND